MRHSEAGLSYCIDLLQRGRGNGSAAQWGNKTFQNLMMFQNYGGKNQNLETSGADPSLRAHARIMRVRGIRDGVSRVPKLL
jgi:hypothetical protein